eukprot:11158412-Lingulodinium_polyedra.AAC.1
MVIRATRGIRSNFTMSKTQDDEFCRRARAKCKRAVQCVARRARARMSRRVNYSRRASGVDEVA